MAKKGLGKGLGAIFGEDVVKESNEELTKVKRSLPAEEEETKGSLMVKISLIEPNRDQPRKDFNEEELQELAESIKNYGVLQPLPPAGRGRWDNGRRPDGRSLSRLDFPPRRSAPLCWPPSPDP